MSSLPPSPAVPPSPSVPPAAPAAHAPLVLASASPRRAEILAMLGLAHRVIPAHVDETRRSGEAPEVYVERLAREKASAVHDGAPASWVLAGDTTVAVEGEVLEKPMDREDAVRMLLSLQGREHQVATGLALASPRGGVVSGVEVTRVRFRPFDEATARAYAATGEPMDKAGAYGIQGMGGALVEGIEGDFSAVVGLSVPLLVRLLAEAGRPYRFPEAGSESEEPHVPQVPDTGPPAGGAPARGSEASRAISEPRAMAHLLLREIRAARRQVLAYPDDEAPWRTLPGWPNSAGTLALHLAGNLQHFVGAILGATGYVRDRSGEFSRRGLSRSELAGELLAAEVAVRTVLEALPPEALDRPWPSPFSGLAPSPVQIPARSFLLHLLAHAAYHLGQMDYHRRAVCGSSEGVASIALSQLPRL
jgi:septum formation protein